MQLLADRRSGGRVPWSQKAEAGPSIEHVLHCRPRPTGIQSVRCSSDLYRIYRHLPATTDRLHLAKLGRTCLSSDRSRRRTCSESTMSTSTPGPKQSVTQLLSCAERKLSLVRCSSSIERLSISSIARHGQTFPAW